MTSTKADKSPNLIHVGVIGIVLGLCIVIATLQYDRLPFLNGGINYSALFTDAGGLMVGDDVTVSGTLDYLGMSITTEASSSNPSRRMPASASSEAWKSPRRSAP